MCEILTPSHCRQVEPQQTFAVHQQSHRQCPKQIFFIFCSSSPNSFQVTPEPLQFLPTSLSGSILCCNHLTVDFLNVPWHSDAFTDVNVDSNQLQIQPLPWQTIRL